MNIRITDDGIVSFEETRILKQVKMTDFIENLKSIKPLSTGFLPSGCILYHAESGRHSYLFEETPQIRILNWNARSSHAIVPYPISLPFIYWFIKVQDDMITSIRGRASKVQVRKLDQELFNMGLPNFYDSGAGEMCRGSTSIRLGKDIHSSIRKAVNAIWDTNWNGDLSTVMPEGIRDYEEWAMKTLADPLLWTKLTFGRCSPHWNTIGGMIETD